HQAYGFIKLTSYRQTELDLGCAIPPRACPIRPTDAFMAQLFVRPITATRRLPRGEHPLL
ncbi:MAG: hypothetical protein ACFN4S_09110, partial [Prevotella conceptionensis]